MNITEYYGNIQFMHLPRKKVHLLYLLVDIVLISLSFYIPYYFRYNYGQSGLLTEIHKAYLLIFCFWGTTLIFILNNLVLYATDRSLGVFAEIWKVIKAVCFSSVAAALIIFILGFNLFSRSVFFFSVLSLILTLASWRVIKRIWIRRLIISGLMKKKALIVGSGPMALELIEEINNSTHLGLEIVGFLDENTQSTVYGQRVLGRIKDFEGVVRKNFIEEVLVTDIHDKEKINFLLQKSREMNIGLRLVMDSFNFSFDKILLNYIGYIPILTCHEKSLHGTDQQAKRVMDFFVSFALLAVLLPFFLIISVLIKLDSPGPVFYISRRCGKNGRIFNFYKFRSMYNDAHELKESIRHRSDVSGPIFKIKNDPRITRLGRFMRRWSIDELPQLINVLKGDMSLVGPRPPTPDEVEKYEPWQLQRLNITPGITCLWQIRGRSELSFYKWMKLDLWYINNWSFGLDMMILWRTVPAVIRGKGAY